MLPPAEVRRIAVLRANGIGDAIFALPALDALRSAYPGATISLLAAPAQRELLSDRPGPIDEVIVVPPSRGVREEPGGVQDPAALEDFFDEMRGRNFDLVLQMHGGGRYSNAFSLRLGGRVTAGFRTPDAAPLDIELPYIYYQSEILRMLELARLLDAPPVGIEPTIRVTARDLEEARVAVGADDRPVAVLNPGAGDPRRRWPTDRFAKLGDLLAEAGARIVVSGGPGDTRLGGEIAGRMRHPVLDLTGRLSLPGLAGLLSRSSVMVTNDSGPLHVGAAVGARTVGIFWCGNQINAGLPFIERHRPILSWRLDCPVCGTDCTQADCPHEESFVADVPVAEVATAAFDLLSPEVRARSGQPTP